MTPLTFARMAAFVLVLSACLFGYRLGDRHVVSEELRWAQIAKEMRQTGRYLHPTINGKLYYDKPLGSYWLIVATSHLTGVVDETTARIPSALAGLLGVFLIMQLTRRYYDDRTAVYAGMILATSYGYVFYSRRSTADMETVAGVLAAVSLMTLRQREPRTWMILLGWLVMSLTSLTKGLLGFALPIVILTVWGSWNTLATKHIRFRTSMENNRWLFHPATILAVPLAATLFLLPYLLSEGQSSGLSLLFRENIQRFFAPHNHTGPVYLYVIAVSVVALPWSLFLPLVIVHRSENAPGQRLFASYFWAVFAFFTLSVSRRSYYILPILPAVAVLIARLLAAETLNGWRQRLRSGMSILLAGLWIIGGLLLIPARWVLPVPYDQLPGLPYPGLFGIGWFVGVCAIIRLRFRPQYHTLGMISLVWLAQIYLFGFAMTTFDQYRTRSRFAQEVNQYTHDSNRLGLFYARDISIDLNRDEPLPQFESWEAIESAVNRGEVRFVIVRRRYHVLLNYRGKVVIEENRLPWEPADQQADKMILIDLINP